MSLALISVRSDIRDTAVVVFVVVPLTLLWLLAIGDTLRRHDLKLRTKVLWLVALVPFPLIGTLLYLVRRPGLRERARSVREQQWSLVESRELATATIDDFAVTVDVAQELLQQSTALLDELVRTLAEAEAQAGRSVPLTHFRPLGPFEVRLARLTGPLRALRFSLARLSLALGTNSADLRQLAREVDRLTRLSARSATSADGAAPVTLDGGEPLVAAEPVTGTIIPAPVLEGDAGS